MRSAAPTRTAEQELAEGEAAPAAAARDAAGDAAEPGMAAGVSSAPAQPQAPAEAAGPASEEDDSDVDDDGACLAGWLCRACITTYMLLQMNCLQLGPPQTASHVDMQMCIPSTIFAFMYWCCGLSSRRMALCRGRGPDSGDERQAEEAVPDTAEAAPEQEGQPAGSGCREAERGVSRSETILKLIRALL